MIALARAHDFLIFSDECYSEIWRDAPPAALAVATRTGRPGGDVQLAVQTVEPCRAALGLCGGRAGQIAQMRRLRSYAGAPLPLPIQRAAPPPGRTRSRRRQPRALSPEIRHRRPGSGQCPAISRCRGGFFLWLPVPPDRRQRECRQKLGPKGHQVLPGTYLSRDTAGEIRAEFPGGAGRHRQ